MMTEQQGECSSPLSTSTVEWSGPSHHSPTLLYALPLLFHSSHTLLSFHLHFCLTLLDPMLLSYVEAEEK